MTEETQGAVDARETLESVLAATLVLAARTIEHVREHDVAAATLDDVLDCGGYAWKLFATYGRGNAFVHVIGKPETRGSGVCTSVAELAAVMQNETARFETSVPRSWVEMAARAAEEIPR